MPEGASGRPLMGKLTLENYLNLEHADTISPAILRKILMIHGIKSCNVPKDDLLGAVRSIKLMDVHRSTLQTDVSSNVFLSVNDVIRDISLLQWQECCITDIETINSGTDYEEELPPKRFKPDCSTVVNGPEPAPGPHAWGSQKQIMDQNTKMGDTEAKRSDRVKKAPIKWKDFVIEAKSVPR